MDVFGVGIGPFNLSVAALLHPLQELRQVFADSKPDFRWHDGLLFDDSTLQVSHMKDLVTLADPTSPFSFIAFLAKTKRLYRFIYADFPRASRREFNQYFRWVSESLPSIRFDTKVEAISLDGETLKIETSRGEYRTRRVVLGTGLTPFIPACAEVFLGPNVFHASNYLHMRFDPRGKRIAVIGGGQTSAEIISQLMLDADAMPHELHWISRRSNYLPLDESAFTNEFFTPAYCEHFYTLPAQERSRLLEEQYLAGNGISPALLLSLYRRMYELEFLHGRKRPCNLLPGTTLTGMERGADRESYVLTTQTMSNLHGQGLQKLEVDAVILCTGWEYSLPACLSPLASRIDRGAGMFAVRPDFSLEWDGPDHLQFYVQNAARHTHGIAEPNLSVMAWRGGKIANSIAGRTVYDIDHMSSVFDWHAHTAARIAEIEHA
ncbi:lysine N(6)-hydroxylase/L-ornithine N(5)-oxygenase family protein [Lysobacter hankyongensis]|uniref:lysine N(6)-hydroxylase/L-ornithine N(5)-oxygenase family protein n=1 Tax=Lysobacter hankyongensis TaxID=1176535 RepID=UPI0031ED2F24